MPPTEFKTGGSVF